MKHDMYRAAAGGSPRIKARPRHRLERHEKV
jgi:hypothetical protein